MARPSSQMGFLWRGSAPPDRAGSHSVIARAVARVVPPFSVNERLRAIGGPIRPPVWRAGRVQPTRQPDRAGADCRCGE
jgi:hypothetical protein